MLNSCFSSTFSDAIPSRSTRYSPLYVFIYSVCITSTIKKTFATPATFIFFVQETGFINCKCCEPFPSASVGICIINKAVIPPRPSTYFCSCFSVSNWHLYVRLPYKNQTGFYSLPITTLHVKRSWNFTDSLYSSKSLPSYWEEILNTWIWFAGCKASAYVFFY